MKIHLEISDTPSSLDFPFEASFHMEGGVKRGPFAYSINEVLEIIKSATNLVEDSTAQMLPEGTLYYTPSLTHRLGIVQEKKKYFIRYQLKDKELLEEIEFPRLLIDYVFSKENTGFRLMKTRIFAIKEEEFNAESLLYNFPFPNVEKVSGSVCWGSNRLITIPSLQEANNIFQTFISAPFNEDYGTALILEDKQVVHSFFETIKLLKGKEFNDEWLIPTGKTLNSIGIQK